MSNIELVKGNKNWKIDKPDNEPLAEHAETKFGVNGDSGTTDVTPNDL